LLCHRSFCVQITSPGLLNAVTYWYDLRLYAFEHYSSAGGHAPPCSSASDADTASFGTMKESAPCLHTISPQPWLQPAIQYLLGGVHVLKGQVAPLVAAHNMYRISFALDASLQPPSMSNGNAAHSSQGVLILYGIGLAKGFTSHTQAKMQRTRT